MAVMIPVDDLLSDLAEHAVTAARRQFEGLCQLHGIDPQKALETVRDECDQPVCKDCGKAVSD